MLAPSQLQRNMSEPKTRPAKLPRDEAAIGEKCVHLSGKFVDFPIEDVETSIPHRFEKIVTLYPDRLAVKMGGNALTYDELNRYANRIARAIVERRGPGSEPIALLLEHGIDVIAAVLGVLKAGKFYVALDPSFPLGRLEYMLQDSEARIVLINNHSFELGEQIAKSSSALLNVKELEQSLSSENLSVRILPSDLVNIRYTSGSTGVPKGVTRNHRSSSQVPDLMQVSPADRFSLVHSLSFGSSAMDLYVSLLNGAAMVLFDLKLNGVQQLASWLDDEQITVCHFPPDLFRQLAEGLTSQQELSHLRLVRLSGASIGRREFDLYRNHFPSTTLLEIGMGSTEAGHISSATLNQTFSFPDEGTPIGYPVKGIEILLLGDDGREVSGEIGEIAVSGPSLAFGYWKEPELTNAKFVPDPRDANRYIYLTGDLGQMLPDGFLIHRGRKDLMVKIRGYRVHISEVEAALLEHSRVKQAGVAAWDRGSGEKYLVGYVVPRQESAVTVSELNEFLRKTLPDYMMPTSYVFLESLPLVNGKLDRTALPLPDHRRPNLRTPYIQPHTELQKGLCQIWAEVLSVDRVGIQDNFLDLGGHSLFAAQIVSRIRTVFSIELPLSHLFESPTVAAMAGIIQESQAQRMSEAELANMLSEIEATTEEEAQKIIAK
jgi:amino acid adenylation domain-containing protein